MLFQTIFCPGTSFQPLYFLACREDNEKNDTTKTSLQLYDYSIKTIFYNLHSHEIATPSIRVVNEFSRLRPPSSADLVLRQLYVLLHLRAKPVHPRLASSKDQDSANRGILMMLEQRDRSRDEDRSDLKVVCSVKVEREGELGSRRMRYESF